MKYFVFLENVCCQYFNLCFEKIIGFFTSCWLALNQPSWNVLLFSCNPIGQLCGPGYSSRTVTVVKLSGLSLIPLRNLIPPVYSPSCTKLSVAGFFTSCSSEGRYLKRQDHSNVLNSYPYLYQRQESTEKKITIQKDFLKTPNSKNIWYNLLPNMHQQDHVKIEAQQSAFRLFNAKRTRLS